MEIIIYSLLQIYYVYGMNNPPQERSTIFGQLSKTIGNTPLREIMPGIFTKFEHLNPGGSHYDRAYFDLIQWLEKAGYIRPGDELRDISSGSAVNSLAYIAQALKYNVQAIVPDEVPDRRIVPAMNCGAVIIRSGAGYMPAASMAQIDAIVGLSKDPAWHRIPLRHPLVKCIVFEHIPSGKRTCFLNHSENLLTVRSFRAIGTEALSKLTHPPHTAVMAVGNGTTLVGVGSALRAQLPDVHLVGAMSPNDATTLTNFGMALPQTDSLALGFQRIGMRMMDELTKVTDRERDAMHGKVNHDQPRSVQLGRSSLVCLALAEQIARRNDGPVLTIGYDAMERY